MEMSTHKQYTRFLSNLESKGPFAFLGLGEVLRVMIVKVGPGAKKKVGLHCPINTSSLV